MDYRKVVEYGRFLRAFVEEPASALVRPEDLAYCASRLLLLAQFVRREDRALAALIEGSLQDLAAMNPEGAIRRVREGRSVWEATPIYWALSCHVLAHTLSEFTRETSPATVAELRHSLADWFPRFRHSLEARGAGGDERQIVCLQCYLTQCGIFHDVHAMAWCKDRLLATLSPERLNTEVALEAAALLAGFLSRDEEAASRSHLAMLLDRAASQSPSARQARESLSDIIPSRPEHVMPSSTATISPRTEAAGRKPVRVKKSKAKKSGGGAMASLLESIAPFLGPAILIGLLIGCVWGFGQFFDWFENTSHVGQQSLGDWYRNARQSNEERAAAEAARAAEEALEALQAASGPEMAEPELLDEPSLAIATPEPEAAPEPADPREVFEEILARDTRSFTSRVRVPREMVTAAGGRATTHGEFVRVDKYTVSQSGREHSTASFAIRWFENGQPKGLQTIDARYAWDGSVWELVGAARSVSPPETPDEQRQYVLSAEERAWAASLFQENPFYQ